MYLEDMQSIEDLREYICTPRTFGGEIDTIAALTLYECRITVLSSKQNVLEYAPENVDENVNIWYMVFHIPVIKFNYTRLKSISFD